MVTVIHKYLKHGQNGIEHLAAYSALSHFFDKPEIDKADASHIVVKKPDLHPVCRLLRQYLKKPRKGLHVLNGMIFHKNIFLRTRNIAKLSLKSVGGVRKKPYGRTRAHGKALVPGQVPELICRIAVIRRQLA